MRELTNVPGRKRSASPATKSSWSILLLNLASLSRDLSALDSTTIVWGGWGVSIFALNCCKNNIGSKPCTVAPFVVIILGGGAGTAGVVAN